MIEALEVSDYAGSTLLLDRVSVRVDAGRLVALVGPNGAGKSTLIKLLSGEKRPRSGEVRLAGHPLTEGTLLERARIRAVLQQSSEQSFPFTASEVVLLGRSPHTNGHETAEDLLIARLTMSALGILGYADRRYPTLSGGEQKRVHVARVLSQIWRGPGPRALLLDEPVASLDLSHQHMLLRQVRRMAEDRCAVVCVLHDLNLAAQYADVIVVLENGRVRASGAPHDVLSRALLRETFGVEAAVIAHPTLPCPLVVVTGRADGAGESRAAHPSLGANQ